MINQNQLALEVATPELMLWVEQLGSGEDAESVPGALTAIDRNEEFSQNDAPGVRDA